MENNSKTNWGYIFVCFFVFFIHTGFCSMFSDALLATQISEQLSTIRSEEANMKKAIIEKNWKNLTSAYKHCGDAYRILYKITKGVDVESISSDLDGSVSAYRYVWEGIVADSMCFRYPPPSDPVEAVQYWDVISELLPSLTGRKGDPTPTPKPSPLL
jgi:hypothetical protein